MSVERLPPPTTRSADIFPTLTAAQMERAAAHGRRRPIQRGDVLVEQGDGTGPFFVVVSGQLEVVRPSSDVETLVAVHGLDNSPVKSTRLRADGLCCERGSPSRVR